MKFLWPLMAALLACTIASAEAQDWFIESDTVLDHERVVPGDVVVLPGATLRLHGGQIEVGGMVHVQQGARLEMGPSGDRPSRLLALDPDERFWIQVDGHVASKGKPRTIVDGLAGEGLSSVLMLPGGFKINGSGELRDIIIRNGTAGLVVEEKAHLFLADARVENLYLMGLAALGTVEMERVEFQHNIIGATGKGPHCSITVRDSTLESMAASFQMNRCPLAVSSSRLLGGSETIVLHGHARYEITDTIIQGYMLGALRSDADGLVVMRDSVLEGGPEARSGLEFGPGNEVHLENVVVARHSEHGLNAQSSRIEIHGGAFRENGGYGIHAVRGSLELSNVDFGSGDEANGKGPLSHLAYFTAYALDETGSLVPGLSLEVYAGDGEQLFEGSQPEGRPLTVWFNRFTTDPEGLPIPAGPFTYRATHTAASSPIEGDVDPAAASLVVNIVEKQGFPANLLVLAAGGVLILAAFAVEPIRRRLRRAGSP